MNRIEVTVSTYCIGCERNEKPIMISLDGKDENNVYNCLDAFLTYDEAKELIKELQDVITKGESK